MVYFFTPVMGLEERMSGISRLESMMSLHRIYRSGLCKM
jgi:hypothetical protein